MLTFLLTFLTFVVVVGLAGIIGNQYSALRKMDKLQDTLEEINTRLKKNSD